jgi:hypothetical protein
MKFELFVRRIRTDLLMNLHLPSANSVSSSFHLTPHRHLPWHLYLARHLHLLIYLTLSISLPYHDEQYSYRESPPNDLVHVPYCKNLPFFGPVLSGHGTTFLREIFNFLFFPSLLCKIMTLFFVLPVSGDAVMVPAFTQKTRK